jgi:hypothetical protein
MLRFLAEWFVWSCVFLAAIVTYKQWRQARQARRDAEPFRRVAMSGAISDGRRRPIEGKRK